MDTTHRAQEFGTLDRAGIEGSGNFGVGLARFVREKSVGLFEVNQSNRQHHRRVGKRDMTDAEKPSPGRYKLTPPPASLGPQTGRRR